MKKNGMKTHSTFGCLDADLKAVRKTEAVKFEFTTTACAASVQRSSTKSKGTLEVM